MKKIILGLLLLGATAFGEVRTETLHDKIGDNVGKYVSFVVDAVNGKKIDDSLKFEVLSVVKLNGQLVAGLFTVQDGDMYLKVDDNRMITIKAYTNGPNDYDMKRLIRELKTGKKLKVSFETVDGIAEVDLKGSTTKINSLKNANL